MAQDMVKENEEPKHESVAKMVASELDKQTWHEWNRET